MEQCSIPRDLFSESLKQSLFTVAWASSEVKGGGGAENRNAFLVHLQLQTQCLFPPISFNSVTASRSNKKNPANERKN